VEPRALTGALAPKPEEDTETAMSDDPLLSSGEFARRSRLSAKALRLYEQQGLLVPDEVDELSRYRRYRAGRLADARLIVWLRRLDMPLADVARVLAAPAAERGALVAEYWDAAEARFAAQRYLAAHVRDLVSGHEGGLTMSGTVQTRDIPEQLVLTEQRHVTPEDLPAWIGAATMRLIAAAEPAGGMVGPSFVVYHGEVNHDSDGPVEVCVPVDPAAAGRLSGPTRTEPAHREAYVRIAKAQVQFPQILSAYETVGRWLYDQGLSASAGPREVYFADWDAAGPDDEVCDIAFPM
jgi:DNA-binding transcriptional MerR regulator